MVAVRRVRDVVRVAMFLPQDSLGRTRWRGGRRPPLRVSPLVVHPEGCRQGDAQGILLERLEVLRPWTAYDAEGGQVRRLPLHVEEPAVDVWSVSIDERQQRDLRGVALGVEHRLTREEPPTLTP